MFQHFHYDLDHSPVVDTIQKSFGYKHSTLVAVAAALLVYALIEIVEAVGLWRADRWAEYLTVVATAMFLPLEIYELTEKISYLKIATLGLNILAVLYILLSKRLFGLRGGRAAFEAERHSASLMEVEATVEPRDGDDVKGTRTMSKKFAVVLALLLGTALVAPAAAEAAPGAVVRTVSAAAPAAAPDALAGTAAAHQSPGKSSHVTLAKPKKKKKKSFLKKLGIFLLVIFLLFVAAVILVIWLIVRRIRRRRTSH